MTQVDFAIITIRPDEFAAVLQRFPTKVQKGLSGRTYGISQVNTKTGKTCRIAVVRSSEQGNDAAQQVANDVINDLDPQILLVVGIAGGVPDDEFTLGDVIISTRIDNLNVSKRFEDGREEFDIRGGIHPGISDITASLLLYQKELAGWNDPGSITVDRPEVDLRQFETGEFQAKIAEGEKNASWYKKMRASITSHFGSEKNRTRPPLFETGTIASSNSLIRNIDLFVQWLQTARNILAVEMESAGVYQATQRIQHQYPVMAIRGISDIIGLERDNQWTKYACQAAAAFAYAFVTAGIITQRENTAPSKGSAVVSPLPSLEQVNAPQVQSENQANSREPIEVFISYSEDDEKFKKQLETHLTMLRREGIIRPWHSQQIEPGQEWEQETARHIGSAQMILLLVSPSFLASDHLYENEMMRAMERQVSEAVRVVPIVLRSVDLGKTPFQKLLSLPRNGKPIDTWRNADEVWSGIAQEIRQVCEHLRDSHARQKLSTHTHPVQVTNEATSHSLVSGTAAPQNVDKISNPTPQLKDFLISCANNDFDLKYAIWINKQLQDAGFSTVLNPYDAAPGSNLPIELELATATAARTILVLSPDYPLVERPDWTVALAKDMSGRERRLVPVYVRKCPEQLQGVLAPIVPIDLIDKSETEAQRLLLEGVDPSRRNRPPPMFPGNPRRK